MHICNKNLEIREKNLEKREKIYSIPKKIYSTILIPIPILFYHIGDQIVDGVNYVLNKMGGNIPSITIPSITTFLTYKEPYFHVDQA